MKQLESILKEDGISAIKFTGRSMLPLLRQGDTLIVRKKEFAEIKIGDIAVFKNREDNRYIAHRVIGKNKGVLITKGDSLISGIDKDPVLAQDLMGIADSVYRQGKTVDIPKAKIRHILYYYLLFRLAQNRFLRPLIRFARKNSLSRFIWRIRFGQILRRASPLGRLSSE